MDVLNSLLNGFAGALEPFNLLMGLTGASLGTLVGALPGLGPVTAIALLLPVAYGMDPIAALIMLGGLYYGAMYGGTITAVLLNVPGESSSVMTALDGHQMAKQGRAGVALTVSAVASFIAGTTSVVLLMLLGPVISAFALRFGPPEYFALMFLGLTLVSGLVGDRRAKGYAMVILGLAIAVVGLDPISGVARFTMGFLYLDSGFGFLPIAIALFAIAEIMSNLERSVQNGGRIDSIQAGPMLPGRSDWRRSAFPIARGTGLGFGIGALPGAGATIASFMSYAVEQKISREPQKFGKGAIEGVASAEAANNASTGGSLLPMLTLGIPGSGTTALLLVALMQFGFAPGPRFFVDHAEVAWVFIASMYVGNLILVVLNTAFIPAFVRLVRSGTRYMNPIVMVLGIVGTFAVQYALFDVWIMFAFAIVGYLLHRYGYPPAPLILAVVLGPLAEQNLRRSLILSDGSVSVFFTRPIAATMMIVAITVIAWPLIKPGIRYLLGKSRRVEPAGKV